MSFDHRCWRSTCKHGLYITWRHEMADIFVDLFKIWIENLRISSQISLKILYRGSIDNVLVLFGWWFGVKPMTTQFTDTYMRQRGLMRWLCFNALWPIQNGRCFPDDMFKCIFLNGNAWISIKISMKFVPNGPINNIPVLVQIMAWRRQENKPLSEPIMVRLPMHICVTRPQCF